MRLPARSLLPAALATLLTAALVVVGVLVLGAEDDKEESPAKAAPFRTTPLSELDADAVTVTRAAFCPAIDPRQVEAALGGAVETERAWANGDEVTLGEVTDVVHEFGCEYVAADGTTARAWVFAPPVTEPMARRLARQLSPARDGPRWCTGSTQSTFGEPSAYNACTGSMAYGGLFGDAWVHCELHVPGEIPDPGPLTDRAGRWCVGVVQATAGS